MGKYKLTKHHIIPRSRSGPDVKDNIAYVPRRAHEQYHTLFSNRTPEEIVRYLSEDFWANKYRVQISKLER